MSDECDPMMELLIAFSPHATQIVTHYRVGQIVQFSDLQHFVISHLGPEAIVLVPIDAQEAERVCGSDTPTTTVWSTN